MATPRRPLTDKNRARARARIVDAASELFAQRGFEAVSVADIAERAEVGRTTFFRHFRDKQEVVFASEQAVVDAIAEHQRQTPQDAPATLDEALAQLREVVLLLCEQATRDVDAYRRHYALIEQHVELQGRDALKTRHLTQLLADLLVHRGADQETARLAAHLAVACYLAGREGSADDPRSLADRTRSSFDRLTADRRR